MKIPWIKNFFMVKSLYFMKVTKIAVYYVIDKGKGYKNSFTPREHSGSRKLQAQSTRGPFFILLIDKVVMISYISNNY